MAHNGSETGKFTPAQNKALAALISHPTVSAAAEACGMGRRTLVRYLADQEFEQAYREAVEKLVPETTAGLQKLGEKSVAVLEEALEDPSINVRVRAARYVLDFTYRVVELSELKRQLEEIEAHDRQMFSGNGGGYGRR